MNKKFIFVLLVFFPAFISFAQGLELNLTLGKMGIMIVKIKLVRHLKEENVLKKFIQHIEKCKQIYITFNPLLVKLMD